jgi:CheY-like chemotaxis protein
MGKILVVDDDPIFCKRVKVTLERGGHEVSTTDAGGDALQTIIRGTIDAVVLDLHMPKMDGAVFLEVLRTCGRWSATPVIIVTANTDGAQFAAVKKLGFSAAFNKVGLKFEDLLTCTDAILTGKPCKGNVEG